MTREVRPDDVQKQYQEESHAGCLAEVVYYSDEYVVWLEEKLAGMQRELEESKDTINLNRIHEEDVRRMQVAVQQAGIALAEKIAESARLQERVKEQDEKIRLVLAEDAALWEKLKACEHEQKRFNETYQQVIQDKCSGDELHCTCVPFLRKELSRLRDAVRWRKYPEEKPEEAGLYLTNRGENYWYDGTYPAWGHDNYGVIRWLPIPSVPNEGEKT